MVEFFGQALPKGPEVSMCGKRKTRGARLVGSSVGLESAVVRVSERCWSVGALGHQLRPVPTWLMLAVSLTLAPGSELTVAGSCCTLRTVS